MSKRSERREADRAARKLASHQQLKSLPDLQPDPARSTSAAQIEANRANAQRSTGPITPEGKAIASRNNTRHGLTSCTAEADDFLVLANESQPAYNQDLANFRSEWKPNTATEHDLVNRMVMHQWLRRRALRLQETSFDSETGDPADIKKFDLYRRYELQHERSFNRALADLQRLRALRIREHNGFESQRRKNEEHIIKMRILVQKEQAITRLNQPTPASASSQSPLPPAAHLSQPLSNPMETAHA